MWNVYLAVFPSDDVGRCRVKGARASDGRTTEEELTAHEHLIALIATTTRRHRGGPEPTQANPSRLGRPTSGTLGRHGNSAQGKGQPWP